MREREREREREAKKVPNTVNINKKERNGTYA